MGAAENLATHLRWAEADDRGDLSQHHEFIHEDIVVDHLDGETIVGRDALIANMQASLDAMPDYSNVIEDRFATDDRVVCRWRVQGTPLGEDGRPGAPIDVRGISVWEFRDGRASRGWICSNAAALAQQGVEHAHAYSINAHQKD